jgi:hypothetical protein
MIKIIVPLNTNAGVKGYGRLKSAIHEPLTPLPDTRDEGAAHCDAVYLPSPCGRGDGDEGKSLPHRQWQCQPSHHKE